MKERILRNEEMRNFIETLKRADKSEKTIETYEFALVDFTNTMFGGTYEIPTQTLADLQREDFDRYIDLLKERGLKPNSVNIKLATLWSFYTFLMGKGIVEINIPRGISKIKVQQEMPTFLEIDESKELVEAVRSHSGKDEDLRVRDELIISIMLNVGLRREEIADLKISDINTKTKEIYVTGKGKKRRKIYLNQTIVDLFLRWLDLRKAYKIKEGYEDYVFVSQRGTNITPRRIGQLVDEYIERTSIEKGITPHKLRHTFATIMLGTGKASLQSMKSMLGHSSVRTTEIYVHTLDVDLKRTSENPIFD